MENELLFGNDSFTSEITKPAEAEACYNYFTKNLTDFRHQLAEAGKGYDEAEATIKHLWVNLAKSSQRVGWTNPHVNEMAKKYGKGTNKALPK